MSSAGLWTLAGAALGFGLGEVALVAGEPGGRMTHYDRAFRVTRERLSEKWHRTA
jgi:hypothetical protein